jgi:mercuric ion binding protein
MNMKPLNIVLAILFVTGITVSASAQTHDLSGMNMTSTKTETFKIFGKCDMCKARIEKTVKADGVTEVAWDAKTQMLTVTFDPAKTSKEALSKKLASVGHDTEKFKAADEAYANLPGCCHYDRSK